MTSLWGREILPLVLVLPLIFTAAASAFVFYLIYIRQTCRWKESNIPYLQPAFLIGHKYFLSLTKYSLLGPMDRISRENADKSILGCFIGTMPVVLMNDPTLIHQVMSKHADKTFSTGFNSLEPEVETQFMIVTDDKDVWKLVRTVLAPVTTIAWLQGNMFDRIQKEIFMIASYIDKAQSESRPISASKITRTFFLNYVSSTFGAEDSEEKKKVLWKINEHFFEPSWGRLLCLFATFISPVFQRFSLFRLMPREHSKAMKEILKQEIEQRDQLQIEKGDFVDILRSARNRSQSEISGGLDTSVFSKHGEMNIRHMTGLGLTNLTTRLDSGKYILPLALHLLSLHPEFQRKIREEAKEAMHRHGVSEINFEVAQDLHFTMQCLEETTRLYPVFVIIMRRCSGDFQIAGTKYILRKGDRVIMAPYSIHRNPKYFPNPHKFEPDRFSPENKLSSNNIFTFGVGPRKCPGYRQTMFVTAAVIASILCKYEMKPHSHLKQMDIEDFHPRGIMNIPKKEVTFTFAHCEQ